MATNLPPEWSLDPIRKREQEAAKYGPKSPTDKEAFAKRAVDAFVKGRGTPPTPDEMSNILARKFRGITSREVSDLYSMVTAMKENESVVPDAQLNENLKWLEELKKSDPEKAREIVHRWKVDAKAAEEELRQILLHIETASESDPGADDRFKPHPQSEKEDYSKRAYEALRKARDGGEPPREKVIDAISKKFPGITLEEASELYDRAWSDHFNKRQEEFQRNDPEGYARFCAKIEADANAARLRINARRARREKLEALLGRTVIVEKKGIASTCCGLLLKGTLQPHEDGLGSFILNIGEMTSEASFFGFYPSSVVEITIGDRNTVPRILLK